MVGTTVAMGAIVLFVAEANNGEKLLLAVVLQNPIDPTEGQLGQDRTIGAN